MHFKVGDKVKFLDEEGGGIVTRVNGIEILVHSNSGFQEWHAANTLVLQDHIEVSSIVIKDQKKKAIQPKKVAKVKEVNEIDLHAEHLFPSLQGRTNYEILSEQLRVSKSELRKAIKNRIAYMVIIHGVGEGVLKASIHEWLNTVEGIEYCDAEFKKYGRGATEIRIIRFA